MRRVWNSRKVLIFCISSYFANRLALLFSSPLPRFRVRLFPYRYFWWLRAVPSNLCQNNQSFSLAWYDPGYSQK